MDDLLCNDCREEFVDRLSEFQTKRPHIESTSKSTTISSASSSSSSNLMKLMLSFVAVFALFSIAMNENISSINLNSV